MSISARWQTLHLPNQDVPPLLVKTNFDDNGYCVQLTDLGRLWEERLTKDEIIDRAASEGCSIDPSETDQYDILFSKITSALRNEESTTLYLRHVERGERLDLDLTAPLPGSLPTFKWTLKVCQQAAPAIACELVKPLLLQANHLQQQIEHLVDELSSKDRVISKITDRLEASGNELAAVFPGVSNIKTNRKKSQREQLAKHVKGLAEFDELAWKASNTTDTQPQRLSSNIIDTVLKDVRVSLADRDNSDSLKQWWQNLSVAKQRSSSSQADLQLESSNVSNGYVPYVEDGKKSIDDGGSPAADFQRQSTPPRLTNADDDGDVVMPSAPSEQFDEADDSTEDEDDLDAPSRTSSSQTKGRSQQEESATSGSRSTKVPHRNADTGKKTSKSPTPAALSQASASQHTKPSKLGAIGGKAKLRTPEPDDQSQNAESIQADYEKESPGPRKPRLGAIGGRREVIQKPKEPDSAASTPKKAKLGAIGGAGGRSIPSLSQDETSGSASATSPAKKGTLGRIGGSQNRAVESQVSAVEQKEERQPRAEEREDVEQERENSQGRADKKRERLRRELEEKAKMPAKKKRKF